MKFQYIILETNSLADIFENFRKMCLEICELHNAKFLSAPVLAWQAALKMTEVELELLADIDILLTLFKMGFFGEAHGWWGGRGLKRPLSIKSVTHILQ